jgi:O-Antigen ligase
VNAGATLEQAGRFDARHPGLVVLAALVFGSLVVGAAAAQGPAAGVVAVLAVAATLWAVSHPTTGAIAIVAIVPAISGMQRGLPVPGLRLGELVAVGFSAILLITAGREQVLRWRTFDWLALGYVVATFGLGFLDLRLRGDSPTSEDLGQLIGPLQFFLLYRAVMIALPRREDRVRAVDWLLIGSIPVCVLAMLQAAHVPGVQELLVTFTGEDWSGRTWTITRVNGPFSHWTMLAGYLFVIVVICTALLMAGVEGRRRRLVLGTLALATVSLVLTVTLAPMLGAIAAALALAWWYRRAGRVLLYGAVICALLAVAFQPLLSRRADDQFQAGSASSAQPSLVPTTVSNRLNIWTEQYLPALEGRWLTGYGPGIPPEITWKHTESIYITMALRGGLPLLALYAALMYALALIALDRGRRREDGADAEAAIELGVARALFVLICVLALIQGTAPYFVTTGLPQVWWILAALVAGGVAHERQIGAKRRQPTTGTLATRALPATAGAAPVSYPSGR